MAKGETQQGQGQGSEVAEQKRRPSPLAVVQNRIEALSKEQRIDLPPDFSVNNAINQAWLILQQKETKDKKPVLEACTRESIIQAMLDMAIQGLNPEREQGYFIAYGQQVVFQKSYFGYKTLAKRANPNVDDIVAEVIWPGDQFEYSIHKGKKSIAKHVQAFENVGSGYPRGAYAEVIDKNGEVLSTTIMTWDQIKAAWRKSKNNPVQEDGSIKGTSTHAQHIEDMTKKTVVGKAARHIVNTSTDSYLFRQAVQRSDEIQDEEEAESEVETQAKEQGAEVIDVDAEESISQQQEAAGTDQQEEPPAAEEPPEEDVQGPDGQEAPEDHADTNIEGGEPQGEDEPPF